jgi:hypothetical protein
MAHPFDHLLRRLPWRQNHGSPAKRHGLSGLLCRHHTPSQPDPRLPHRKPRRWDALTRGGPGRAAFPSPHERRPADPTSAHPPAPLQTFTRGNGVTESWAGDDPTALVTIQGLSSITRGTRLLCVLFECWARNQRQSPGSSVACLFSPPPGRAGHRLDYGTLVTYRVIAATVELCGAFPNASSPILY